MNERVDVLAVVDREMIPLAGAAAEVENYTRAIELNEVRAAVAELIEAGPAMLRFLDQHQYLDRDGSVQRFRAALARVGGAA